MPSYIIICWPIINLSSDKHYKFWPNFSFDFLVTPHLLLYQIDSCAQHTISSVLTFVPWNISICQPITKTWPYQAKSRWTHTKTIPGKKDRLSIGQFWYKVQNVKQHNCCDFTAQAGYNSYPLNKMTDWLSDWLLCERVSEWWLVDWLADWSIDWLIEWLIDWLNDWLIDWLISRSYGTRTLLSLIISP